MADTMVSPRVSSAELVRQLGVTSAAALVISNMVGTGIFATTGFLAGDLGSPPIVLLIWVVGALFALAGAFCYSELGVNFPSSGGEYVYLTRAYGPTWGFMTGWASFFAGFSAPIAATALAFSDYAGFFNPALKQANAQFTIGSGTWQLKLGGAQLLASAVIGALTILNLYGVKRVARVQNTLTGLKMAVILAFIGFGLLAGNGSWSHFSLDAVRTSARPLLQQFAVSLVWIYVAYSGWNAATYVAEELRQPSRTLPLALTLGTLTVAALFILLNVVFIYAVPLEAMKGVLAVGSLAATRLFGEGIGGVFSALMAVSLLATINAMVTIGPRVYYAMAKNGAFFPIAARVDQRHHIPRAAVLLQGLCAMLMTLTPFPQLVIYIGLVLNFFAVMSVASVFIFRRRPEWQRLKIVSFAWPLMPLLFIGVGVWITIYGALLEPRVSAATLLTITLGALIYHFRVRGARQER
ncbi:MAG TPA: amino acid permease [Bryobacteraceae bacterium]|nr:amino acid permease [Bryobacteraceae bacterium]